MKSSGILHSNLSAIVAQLGHGDEVVIADYGLPVPPGVAVIDLAVSAGLPGFLAVLRTVLSELCVEHATIASELKQNSVFFSDLVETLPCDFADVSHDEFKALCRQAKVVVRTGEWTPYANVILTAGVPF